MSTRPGHQKWVADWYLFSRKPTLITHEYCLHERCKRDDEAYWRSQRVRVGHRHHPRPEPAAYYSFLKRIDQPFGPFPVQPVRTLPVRVAEDRSPPDTPLGTPGGCGGPGLRCRAYQGGGRTAQHAPRPEPGTSASRTARGRRKRRGGRRARAGDVVRGTAHVPILGRALRPSNFSIPAVAVNPSDAVHDAPSIPDRRLPM